MLCGGRLPLRLPMDPAGPGYAAADATAWAQAHSPAHLIPASAQVEGLREARPRSCTAPPQNLRGGCPNPGGLGAKAVLATGRSGPSGRPGRARRGTRGRAAANFRRSAAPRPKMRRGRPCLPPVLSGGTGWAAAAGAGASARACACASGRAAAAPPGAVGLACAAVTGCACTGGRAAEPAITAAAAGAGRRRRRFPSFSALSAALKSLALLSSSDGSGSEDPSESRSLPEWTSAGAAGST